MGVDVDGVIEDDWRGAGEWTGQIKVSGGR